MAKIVQRPSFLTHLKYEEVPGSNIVILTSPFVYYSAVINRTIVIPVGFQCDKESIGRWPIIYLCLGNSSAEAGFIHDYLYRKDSEPIVSRSIADDIYYEASCLDGNYRVQAYAKWLGVRIGGASSYHKLAVLDEL